MWYFKLEAFPIGYFKLKAFPPGLMRFNFKKLANESKGPSDFVRNLLRTLAHEWIHEYQYQKMGLKDNQKIQDIGGPEENMANILSGIFIKKFEKQYPNHSKLLYGENS